MTTQRRIGVLGGGQLGRMMAHSAHCLGHHITVLDPDEHAPARATADKHIIGDYKDSASINSLAKECDVITVETEHVNVAALKELALNGVEIHPRPEILEIIQDKLRQKEFMREHAIPLGDFVEVTDSASIRAAGERFGYPIMLKSRFLSYDGKGNVIVRTESDIDTAVATLSSRASQRLYVEKLVPFVGELAVVVVCGSNDDMRVFPIVEMMMRDNICDAVLVPALIPAVAATNATRVAMQAIKALRGVGVFAVELFLLSDNTVLFNEVAPRPHNSAHFTIDACVASQFDAHVRAILHQPLPDVSLKVGAAGMLNILGTDTTMESPLAMVSRALALEGATVHWYGKLESRPGRKLGHVNLVAGSRDQLLGRLQQLSGEDHRRATAPLVGIIMGSDSDLPTMKPAAQVLDELGVPFELTIVSAHRTPLRMVEYAQSAVDRGLRVIIAGAGGAAHLPGMVAALTLLPVVGVPVGGATLAGQDALFSIVQMPRGIPVATVAINNALNGGLLAARILGATDAALRSRLAEYQKRSELEVLGKVERLQNEGWASYK